MGFNKSDSRKSRLDLIPARALEFVGFALRHGAQKYDDEQWRNCKKPSRFVAASLRHEMRLLQKEFTDPESGLPHLAHSIVSLLFALDLYLSGVEDRLMVGNYFAIVRRVSPTRGKILKRFKSFEKAWGEFLLGDMTYDRMTILTVPSNAKVGDSYPLPKTRAVDKKKHGAHKVSP